MIDFHCHIDLYPNPKAVLDQARARGVYILAVTTTPKAWEGNKRLVGDDKRVRIGVGLHPELVAERHAEVPLLKHFMRETRYVGEIGLDGSPHMKGSFKLQEATLGRILSSCAEAGGRILSLHSRRAASGVLDALEAQPKAGTPILHWFSGTPREIERAVRLGCWFSVGPSMLKSAKGRTLTSLMPKDRILTETDSPFAQIDGKPLMPWDVSLAFPTLAEIWGCEFGDVAALLDANLRVLVGPSRA